MISFSQLWHLRSQGVIFRPSMLIGAFTFETLDIAERISKMTQIPYLIMGAVKEQRQVQSFYQIPLRMLVSPYLYLINARVRDVCWAALGILSLLSLTSHLWRPLASYMMPGVVQKPIDLDEENKFIQRAQRSIIHQWGPKLQREGELPTIKREVSDLCRDFIYHLKEVKQASVSVGLDEISSKFIELKGLLDGMVLEPIAEKDDPPKAGEEATGSSLFVRLGALGLRKKDFEHIATRIGWDQEEHTYLTLRFAEKGIFSINDLTTMVSLQTNDEKVDHLVKLLQDRVVPVSAQWQRWESIKQVASQIDRLAASIFAVSFQLFSFTSIYYTPLILKILYLVDGVYMGSRMGNIQNSRSDFASATLTDRLYWIIQASCPIYSLSYVLTKAMRGPGLQALPRVLYETYLV